MPTVSPYLPNPESEGYQARMEEIHQAITGAKPLDNLDAYPSAPNYQPYEPSMELPSQEEVPAVKGLMGRIREMRIERAVAIAEESVKDVAISQKIVTDETKSPRKGWPGTLVLRKAKKDEDGNKVKDSYGNQVYEPNELRPVKRHHRRKSMKAGRLALRRGGLSMERNRLLAVNGAKGPADKIGVIADTVDLYRSKGLVADVRSGARSRDVDGPRTRAEERHLAKVDRAVAKKDRKIDRYSRKLDKMANSPRARVRGERAAKRANRLAEKQREAANEQRAKAEMKARRQRQRARNAS